MRKSVQVHVFRANDRLDVVRAGLLRRLVNDLPLEHLAAVAVLVWRLHDLFNVGLP